MQTVQSLLSVCQISWSFTEDNQYKHPQTTRLIFNSSIIVLFQHVHENEICMHAMWEMAVDSELKWWDRIVV